jgi:hypothetical protein
MLNTNNLVKLTLLVLVAVVLSTTIGGNGCLWVGNGNDETTPSGSSGAVQAASPSPTDGAVNVALTAQLSWASVSGMTSYDVYLDSSNPPAYRTNVRNIAYRTRYTPPIGFLNYSTLYYWRIDSKNSSGTYIGNLWTFTTVAQTVSITYISPPNAGADIPVSPTPTLSWNPVSGAASYDVYFGTYSPGIFITNTAASAISTTPLSYNTVYYWRVNPRNSGGSVMVTGPVWNFRTISTLTQADSPSPVSGATNVSITSQLSWASGAGATGYVINLGLTSTPWSVISPVAKTLYRTTYTPALEYGKTYYWRVDAYAGAVSITGVIWNFSTIQGKPDAASNPNPATTTNNAAITTQLSWATAARAASYDVYFGTVATPPYKTNRTVTNYNPGTLAYGTTYYWQINTRNSTGVTTGALWSFSTVSQPTPAKATDPYPVDNAIDCSVNTQISWVSASDATSYDVYFGITATPPMVGNVTKAVYRTIYTPGALYPPTNTLAYSTSYYWKIVPRNASGPCIETIPVWSFKTMTAYPFPVEINAPISGQTNCLINQTVSWKSAALADSYDVYFGTVSVLNSSHFKKNVPRTGAGTYTYTPTGLAYPSIIYYWRIDSRNTTGITTGQVWNFRTKDPPPEVTDYWPISNTVDISPNAVLTWTGSTLTDSYNIQLSTIEQNVINLVALVTNTAMTYYQPAPMTRGQKYYWRVIAINPAGATPGQVWNFTIVDIDYITMTGPGTVTSGVPDTYSAESISMLGNPIPNDSFNWTVIPGTGTANLDTAGPATSVALTGIISGTVTLRARSVLDPIKFVDKTVTVIPNVPATLTFIVGPVDTVAGELIPQVEVEAQDLNGNIVADLTAIVMTSNAAQLNGTPSQNTTGGVATFNDLYITTTGTYVLTATSGAAVQASTDFSILAAPIDRYTVTAAQYTVGAGSLQTGTVTAKDSYGNTVASASTTITMTKSGTPTVIFYTNGGYGTPATTYAYSGGAQTVWYIAGGTESTFDFTATDGAGKTGNSGTVTMTYGAIDNYIVASNNSTVGAGTEQTGTVMAQDAYGNTVTSASSTISMTNSDTPTVVFYNSGYGISTTTYAYTGGTRSVWYVASGLTGNTFTFTATDENGKNGVSGTVTLTFGAAANLSFVQQPTVTTATMIIAPAITVRARDASTNLVPNVSVSVTTTNGTLMSGTVSTQTDSSGIATFDNLSISVAGNNYVLSASATACPTITSTAFNILPNELPGTWSRDTFTTGTFTNCITTTGAADVILDQTPGTFVETFSTAAYRDWGVISADWNTGASALKLPETNIWAVAETLTTGTCPSVREQHSAIWNPISNTMIIWGGLDAAGTPLNTGGVYSPTANTWGTAPTTTGAPTGRWGHSAIWTGSKMIIWGGEASAPPYFRNTGGVYDPAANAWVTTGYTNLINGTGAPTARRSHSAVWTGTKMIVWGGYDGGTTNRYNDGGVYDPATDSWTPMTTTNAPTIRSNHIAVWTGTRMIVWGGFDNVTPRLDDGGVYDPSTDSWSALTQGGTPPTARYMHSAIWTGSKMIVWGGFDTAVTQTGGVYNPATNSWGTVPSIIGAPTARYGQSAVWTGTRMIIWGGWQLSTRVKTGGMYDPDADIWGFTTTTTSAPTARSMHTAVWNPISQTMIVWGGYDTAVTKSGGQYYPATNSWGAATPTSGNCPTARQGPSAVWTGSKMIVWGGWGPNPLNTGGVYDPVLNTWTTVTTTGAPATGRYYHSAVWTGSGPESWRNKMIIWGGSDGPVNTGAVYDLATDSWVTNSYPNLRDGVNAPSARTSHTAVWNTISNTMIVWGGSNTNTGKPYDPGTDTWGAATSTGTNCPSARSFHSAVWADTRMIIWGGNTTTGGVYNPATNSWDAATSTNNTPSSRQNASAVWTGNRMIIWGGYGSSTRLQDGYLYDPGYATPKFGQSLKVNASTLQITRATLTVTATTPANTAITYELTTNGGTNWYSVTPGSQFTFSVSGADLRWRANLSNSDRFATPSIDELSISYPSGYSTPGTYTGTAIAPSGTIVRWNSLTFTYDAPISTTFSVDVLSIGNVVLLTKTVPSGTSGVESLDLSGINAVTYPSIKLRANFATTDTTVTPRLLDWTVNYTYTP